MRKLKYILPLLTATLLLLPGMAAEAATTKKELATGTKDTSLSIVLSDKQSIEGQVSVKSKTSGQTIKLQSVNAQTSDAGKTAVCESSGNKIYMVSKGDAVTTTVTIKVQFSGDGEYTVALKGGCTDKDGKYESDGIKETFKVTVGTSVSENEEADDEEAEEETEEEETEEETEEEEVEEETKTTTSDSKKDKKEQSEKTDREPVKVLSEDERVIEEFIEEVEEELKKEEKAEKEKVVRSPKSLGSFLKYLKNFWFIFLILFIFLLICIYLLWKLLRKNRKNDYDGAPMVDYRIEDDD